MSADTRKGLWLVMDGRAELDADDASIMECIGEGRRDQIPRKAARRAWDGYDACLCFCPKVDKQTVGPAEFVERVSP